MLHRLPTGKGALALVHDATIVAVPSGLNRASVARSAPSTHPASSATAANTASGGVPRATSVATRRSAACSPVIRSSPARPGTAAILRSLSASALYLVRRQFGDAAGAGSSSEARLTERPA